ncbi:unnamed protein product [Brassica rapa subsp. trilocularis]
MVTDVIRSSLPLLSFHVFIEHQGCKRERQSGWLLMNLLPGFRMTLFGASTRNNSFCGREYDGLRMIPSSWLNLFSLWITFVAIVGRYDVSSVFFYRSA